MAQFKCTHPVQWPAHSARTQKWERSVNPSFKAGMTLQEAAELLKEEATALGGGIVTLSTDIEHLDNPRAMRSVGYDAGAVIKILLDGKTYDLACDRWVQLEHNIYALSLALRNIRSMQQWGVGTLHHLLGGFTGQAAAAMAAQKPANPESAARAAPALEDWRLLLGLGPTATLEDAHAVYRRRAKNASNDEQELMRLNLAMDAAAKAFGG